MKKILSIILLLFMSSFLFAVSLNEIIVVAEDGTFLGTFENEYSPKSIYNQYGSYGSKYNSISIMNKWGTYGSDYSQYSPFNEYATKAPWLMDRKANNYGRLSINKYATGITSESYNLALYLKALRDSM